MTENSQKNLKYLENENSMQGEIKSIFHNFWSAIIEANNKNFFWKVRVRF